MRNPTTTTNTQRAARNNAGRSSPHPAEAHQPAARVESEDAVLYLQRVPGAKAEAQAQHEADVLAEAEDILRKRWQRLGTLTDPAASAAWLRMHCAGMVAETFGVILLDNRHRILRVRELFNGTIDGASVPPREVVRAVLEANAAAVVLYHNHPSGNPEPSSADVAITQTLKQALNLIGCLVLDHLIAGETVTSLSQRGLC